MIDIKDEILMDFSVNSTRTLITDKLVLVDNIVSLIDFSDKSMVIQSGKNNFTIINGKNIQISSFQNSRIVFTGEISSVEFHKNRSDLEK